MQHHNGRLSLNMGMSEYKGVGRKTYNSLKMNCFKERGFMDPVSTFNTRKEFRVDPRKQKLEKIKAQQQ